MKLLAIETSCDETAAAVVGGPSTRSARSGLRVLSNVVASSEEMHKKTGGIIPEVAAREQLRSIIPVIDESIKVSKCKSIKEIDAIAVTVGPGLIGSLLVGVETARTLAYAWEKPIIAVNHLVAHLYANFVRLKHKSVKVSKYKIPGFPAVGLVVSGGHTDLVLMEDHGKIKLLGRTRDDAAGECFDKCARALGLPYPGGPALAAAAAKFEARNSKSEIKLPRPLIYEDTYDFSFSGLKTAVARTKIGNKAELAHEIQEAIVEVLVERVVRAAEEFKPKSILLGGGVAANARLRQVLTATCRKLPAKLFIPEPKLCTDNAAVVGVAAYYNYQPTPWQHVKADPGLEITNLS